MKATKHAFLALVTLVGLGITQSVNADLIVNGGFETGDFTGWTVTHAATGSHIFVAKDPFHPSNGFIAFFDATGPDFDTISQTFVTKPGSEYTLRFRWETRHFDPHPDNAFMILFGDRVFGPWINLFGNDSGVAVAHVHATHSLTTLEFKGRNALGDTVLDFASLTPRVPDTGSTFSILSFALLGLAVLRRKLSEAGSGHCRNRLLHFFSD